MDMSHQEDSSQWVTSKFEEIRPPTEGLTVPQFCQQSMQGWGHLVAFECAVSGRKYTHDQVHVQSKRFALSLLKAGFKRKDVIAIMLPNCIEYPIVLFGVWYAGCIASLINPAYTASELESLLSLLGNVRGIVLESDEVGERFKLDDLRENFGLSLVVTLADCCRARDGYLSFDVMVAPELDPMGLLDSATDEKHSQETCLIPFSSGTTGLPKGVELTHANLIANLLQTSSALSQVIRLPQGGDDLGDDDDDDDDGSLQERLIAVLPFFHVYAAVAILQFTMLRGCHTLVLPKFIPSSFAKTLRHHRPTFMHLVPPLVAFLVNSSIQSEDVKSVRTIITGGAPAGKSLIYHFQEKFGREIALMEAYGMTELSVAATMLRPWIFSTEKYGSVGELLGSTVSKILDVSTEKTLPPHCDGEVCFKGPQVMKGYYGNDEATRATVDSQGWLHTGDIGHFDEDGCLYIVGRLKELIKVKCFQVAPSELENLLLGHEKVQDVAVIGIPDKECGELPRAYIVPKKAEELKAEEIHEFVKSRVTSYKRLRGGIEFLEAIPRSASGKILRKDILKRFHASCCP